MSRGFNVALVLSGGNALGAFQAGVYEALHHAGLRPDWVVGASIGALNGAVIAGSPVTTRVERLRSFWRPHVAGPLDLAHRWLGPEMETHRRSAAVAWTATSGRAGVFGPLFSAPGLGINDRPSIYETDQLVPTIARFLDVDLLNSGSCRFTATAVDVESGDDVAFDTARTTVGPEHLRASAALPILFPAVEINGRSFVDGGLSANLPLDPVLSDPPVSPTLCIAVDLLPASGAAPRTLGEAAGRMQDLVFAAQSRRSIARWKARYDGRDDRSLCLVRLSYNQQDEEVAGKAFDFSGPTLAKRWAAGHDAGVRLVARLDAGVIAVGQKGLSVTEMA